MRYLSGTDTFMLYTDQPRAQNMLAAIAVYDPASAPGGVTFDDVLEYVRARLHLSGTFRERLVRTPFGLDRPMWINDPDFDLEYHVREIAIPSPGTWQQFTTQIARLGSQPLDLTRPPWELYVIYGLDGIEGVPAGAFATMLKLHHAAIDGVSGAQLVTALMQSQPGEPPSAPTTDWSGEHVPPYVLRLAHGGIQTLLRPIASYRQFLRAAGTMPRAIMQTARPRAGSVRLGAAPVTRFNRTISAHRVWDMVRFDLGEIKQVKQLVAGATVNDVAVALIGGALRRYLIAGDELPKQTMVATMPISLRPTMTQQPAATQLSAGGGGNRFAMGLVALGTNVPEPVQRLEKVQESTAAAKAYGLDAKSLMEASEAIPGALIGTAGRAVSRLLQQSGRAAATNLVITNVPGPRTALYFSGAKCLFQGGMPPIVDGQGLLFGVGGYVDELAICWTADRDKMADPEFFANCLRSEFDEYRKAAV